MTPQGFEKVSMDDGMEGVSSASASGPPPTRVRMTGPEAQEQVHENQGGPRVIEVHHHHYHDGAVTVEQASDVEFGSRSVPGTELAGQQQHGPSFFQGFWEYLNSAAAKLKEDALVAVDASKPWGDFLAFRNWSFPLPGETADRVAQNFEYFKVNYGIVAASCAGFFVIINPVSLAIFGVVSYAVGKKLQALHRQDPTYQSNRGKVIGWSIVGFLGFMLTGVGPSMLTGISLAALFCTLHCLGYRVESLDVLPHVSPATA